MRLLSSRTEKGGDLDVVSLKYNNKSLQGELYLRSTPPSIQNFKLDSVFIYQRTLEVLCIF